MRSLKRLSSQAKNLRKGFCQAKKSKLPAKNPSGPQKHFFLSKSNDFTKMKATHRGQKIPVYLIIFCEGGGGDFWYEVFFCHGVIPHPLHLRNLLFKFSSNLSEIWTTHRITSIFGSGSSGKKFEFFEFEKTILKKQNKKQTDNYI